MIGTNIYISQETQESLIKAAALKEISVEELASSMQVFYLAAFG